MTLCDWIYKERDYRQGQKREGLLQTLPVKRGLNSGMENEVTCKEKDDRTE